MERLCLLSTSTVRLKKVPWLSEYHMDHLDHQDPGDHRDHRVSKVKLDFLDEMVSLVTMGFQDRLATCS